MKTRSITFPEGFNVWETFLTGNSNLQRVFDEIFQADPESPISKLARATKLYYICFYRNGKEHTERGALKALQNRIDELRKEKHPALKKLGREAMNSVLRGERNAGHMETFTYTVTALVAEEAGIA